MKKAKGLFSFFARNDSYVDEDEPVADQLAEITENKEMFPEAGVNYRMGPDGFDKITGGEDCDEVSGAEGEFGRCPLNPIPVNGILGEIKYIARLSCKCGGLLFHRLGSANWRGADIDVYETVCLTGKHWDILYLDFYHPRRSRKLPSGYSALPYNKTFSKLSLAFGTNKRAKQFPYDLPAYIEMHSGMKALAEKCAKLIEASDFQRPQNHLDRLGDIERMLDGFIPSS